MSGESRATASTASSAASEGRLPMPVTAPAGRKEDRFETGMGVVKPADGCGISKAITAVVRCPEFRGDRNVGTLKYPRDGCRILAEECGLGVCGQLRVCHRTVGDSEPVRKTR